MAEAEFEFRAGDSTWRLNMGDVGILKWTQYEREAQRHIPETNYAYLADDFVSGHPSAMAKLFFFWVARREAGEKLDLDSPALDVASRDFDVRFVGTLDGNEGEQQEAGKAPSRSKKS